MTDLFGNIVQILGLQYSFLEVRSGAGWGSFVRLRVKGSQGIAKISCASPLLQYIRKLLLILQACSA